MAVDGDLSMVSGLLDISAEYTDVCSVPLFHYLKLFGVNDSFLKLLETCLRTDSPLPEKILFELKSNELSDLMQVFLNQLFVFFEQGENINLDILLDYFDELSLKQQDLVIRKLVNDEGKSSPKRLIVVSKYFCKKEGYESSRMILDSIVSELRSFDYLTQYKIIRERAFSNLKLYTSSDQAIQLNLKYLLKESEDLLIYGIDLLKKTDLQIELSILYEDLGYSFSVRKSYNQALSFYDRALEIRLTLYGEQHSIIADLYNKYGYIERENRNYNLEEEYCLKALKIREHTKGVNHLFTSTNYLHYGKILFRKKDYQQALLYLNKCLAIRMEKLGENHEDTKICQKLVAKIQVFI
jgi:tetratricopeptide (TPR) repeat protein